MRGRRVAGRPREGRQLAGRARAEARSARRRRAAGLLLATGALLVLVALAAGPASAWHPAQTEAEAHRRARDDARHRAELLVVPPGAREVARLPGRLGLGKPPVRTSNRWVDIASRWRTNWPMAKVVAFLRTHKPKGAGIEDEGAQVYRGRTIEHELGLTWNQYEWWASERDAYVRVVPDGRGSALRFDTVASWRPVEPSADVIPTTGFLKIRLTHERPERTQQVAEITDRATIAAIAELINGLPFAGPHGKYCPETDTGDLWLTFRTAPEGKEVAGVRQELPACGYTLEPEVERKLSHDRVDGQKLLEAVEPLLPAPEPGGRF
jgi:hypothetical protein